MKWLIQDSLTWAALENNIRPLVVALRELNIPFASIGVVPFTIPSRKNAVKLQLNRTVTGLDDHDPEEKTMFYGSTKLVEITSGWRDFRPGVFYDDRWFDPQNWIGKRPDLLNENIKVISVGQLKRDWVSNVSFIKPVTVKAFTGQVIEVEEHKDWLDEYRDVPANVMVCVSDCVNIEREWRFFIVNGEIITGSLYNKFGCRITKEPITPEVWNKAREMAKVWMPSQNIVMDICKLNNGEFKVVEWNCLNASGFYNSDCKAFVIAMEKM